MHSGIEFLLNVNLGYKFTIGKKVLVIGGGNVAMDVARSAAREVVRQHVAGVEDAEPSEENVTAVATHEMVDISLSALAHGRTAKWTSFAWRTATRCQPRWKKSKKPKRKASSCIPASDRSGYRERRQGRRPRSLKTKYVFDENQRFNPAFYENSETQFECDTIIIAIGQAPNLDFLRPEDGVVISPRGLIAVNPQTLMTSAPGIFAGGDCVFGPRLIIDSVGDGKRAAVGIDEYLRGAEASRAANRSRGSEAPAMPLDFMDIQRQPIPMLPLERRTGMTEVEIGYDAQRAMEEAQRCLHCWVNTIFEGNQAGRHHCILCGGCVDVCPENCLELVSLDRIEFEPDTIEAAFATTRVVRLRTGRNCSRRTWASVAGSAMLKDETRCIRCGLCAVRCPVSTITMESYNLVPAEPTGLITIEAIDGPFRAPKRPL